jgi:hypothetical protein
MVKRERMIWRPEEIGRQNHPESPEDANEGYPR